MDTVVTKSGLAPFSLKDAPALIERVFPAQKVGVEAQKERKAGAGQTLTALGSYWKGRKPLVLVRATVLASLLPATNDPEGDLHLFEMVMRMDESGLLRREPKITASHVWASPAVPKKEKLDHIEPPRVAELADDLDAERDDNETDAPVRRGGGARWHAIDLSQFDDAEAKVKAQGELKVIAARATASTAAERDEAGAIAKADARAALAAVLAQREAERERIHASRRDMMRVAFLAMPFSQQVSICERVEKLEDIQDPKDPLYVDVWDMVNARLGTAAFSIPNLVEQLGVARFGHRPVVGDPFAGGGSIPFEAARVGCNVVASDLNPIAAMLTWGALNIVGTDETTRARISQEQRRIAEVTDSEVTRLSIEHNDRGDRAKAYLYCLEAVDPQTGWRVPLAPSWVISRSRRCIARLVPDHTRKRFDITVEENVSNQIMRDAEAGTVRDGHLVYRIAAKLGGEEQEWRLPIARLRGDGEGPEQPDGSRGNRLRPWAISDVVPREPDWLPNADPVLAGGAPGAWVGGDIWLERLYCVQWMHADDVAMGRRRPRTRFAAPDGADMQREALVLRTVQENLARWQANGFVPDMRIEPGDKTDEPIRTRGWTYWHHLFSPRHLLIAATMREHVRHPDSFLQLAASLNRMSRLSRWETGAAGPNGGPMDRAKDVFSNQALNTLYNYAVLISTEV